MASTAPSGTDGPGRPVVVVGIDGSDPSRAAPAWAVTYAEEVGATVRAVAVWQKPSAVENLVARGDPGDVLLEHASDADALVLGDGTRPLVLVPTA